MSNLVGFDARETSNVIGTIGLEESRRNVLRTKRKKGKKKDRKGGIGVMQKNKAKKNAKRPTSSSGKTSSPSWKFPVSDQQQVIKNSSNTEPELILDPIHPKIFIASSMSIPAISNFLPPIISVIPQVQDHTLVAPQTSFIHLAVSSIINIKMIMPVLEHPFQLRPCGITEQDFQAISTEQHRFISRIVLCKKEWRWDMKLMY
ncbi:hypothetical protein BPAE_0301g00050 [Botrytis paeoniae]|uniref:Uncharacterized protein n=1 Tax=Botrytis paeoniae TaxID=278948 RepID=A0A4Z1FA53_9HELO|nr:hypothetical protein BPAE_0301g00050 [Botrytis paeoniae]